jgi:TPR repeat protein
MTESEPNEIILEEISDLEKDTNKIENSLENITDIGIKCGVLCQLAEYYDLKHQIKNDFNYKSKIHHFYSIAMGLKCLPAYIMYSEWLSKQNHKRKMIEILEKAIDLYYANDYYKIEDTMKNTEYFESKITKSLHVIGNYYDSLLYPTEETNHNIIKYYTLAIERGSVNSMFNLGHYYYECNEFEKMMKYYLIAIELGDIDTMYDLSIYYQNIKDFDNMRKYYLMALEETEKPDHPGISVNDGEKDFDLFVLKEELDKIENKPYYLLKKLQKISCIKEIMIFENKKKLFGTLNYILECGICCETKLHVDLYCGHVCCITCYPKLYTKRCPYCRL